MFYKLKLRSHSAPPAGTEVTAAHHRQTAPPLPQRTSRTRTRLRIHTLEQHTPKKTIPMKSTPSTVESSPPHPTLHPSPSPDPTLPAQTTGRQPGTATAATSLEEEVDSSDEEAAPRDGDRRDDSFYTGDEGDSDSTHGPFGVSNSTKPSQPSHPVTADSIEEQNQPNNNTNTHSHTFSSTITVIPVPLGHGPLEEDQTDAKSDALEYSEENDDLINDDSINADQVHGPAHGPASIKILTNTTCRGTHNGDTHQHFLTSFGPTHPPGFPVGSKPQQTQDPPHYPPQSEGNTEGHGRGDITTGNFTAELSTSAPNFTQLQGFPTNISPIPHLTTTTPREPFEVGGRTSTPQNTPREVTGTTTDTTARGIPPPLQVTDTPIPLSRPHTPSHNPVIHTSSESRIPLPRDVGTQTDGTGGTRGMEMMDREGPPFPLDTCKIPLFPPSGAGIISPASTYSREKLAHTRVKYDVNTNLRHIFISQTEEEESIMTAKSIDTLIDQIRTLMIDSAKYATRADFLHRMNNKSLYTPWATTEQPYPPFLQTNSRLLAKIREVRQQAANSIQQISAAEFEPVSQKLEKEGQTLISTLESMAQGKNAPSLDERLTHTASHVGRAKATLETKLEYRLQFLAQRQPTSHDWDDFFHYQTAYRRNNQSTDLAFEVSPDDRAQAEADDAREIRDMIRGDSDEDFPTQTPQNKRRRRTPSRESNHDTYRIPKRPQHTQPARGRQPNPSHKSSKGRGKGQDFGRSRPAQSQQVYYNTDHRRSNDRSRDNSPHRNQRAGRDNSSGGNLRARDTGRDTSRDNSSGGNNRARDTDRDRERRVQDLLHELDKLRRT